MDNPWMSIEIQTKLTSYDGPMIIILLRYMLICRERTSHLDAECEEIVFDKIAKCSKMLSESSCYGNSELLLHKKIWDVLNRNKQGLHKEHSFVDWCRRIARIGAEGAATEHANDESRFRKLAEDIFARDLTAEQKDDPTYWLSESKSITTKQRNLINVIMRKNLGDYRVAYYILEHGIPRLLNPENHIATLMILRRQPGEAAHLQNMLEEFLIWHSSLLQWLTKLLKSPNTIMARKLSDRDQKEWQAERRRRKYEVKQQMREGAHLAELRDTDCASYDNMSATEQRVLEGFECGQLKKILDQVRVQKPEHCNSNSRQEPLGNGVERPSGSNRKRSHDMSATEQRVFEDCQGGKSRKLYDEVRARKPEHCSGNSRQR